MTKEASILIGGEAGDGVRNAGGIVGRILSRHGQEVFVLDDYQSLIRGGHNFVKVRASEEEVSSHYEEVDLVVALNEETIGEHEGELSDSGWILFDSDEFDFDSDKALPVPASSMVEEVGGIKIMRNSVLIGVTAYLYDLDIEVVKDVMQKVYGDKAEKNIILAEKGFDYAKENEYENIIEVNKTGDSPLPLLTGNEAIALGSAKAGLRVYIAYPMTPATSILHHLAEYEDELDLTVFQPENEIGVINMAMGSAYAGARTMVGSSGGGFALMQETVSLAGLSETPILIIECQRTGPSTGVPTYTAQADLEFALNSGHGEFPMIVLAPGDTEEAFYRTGEALNLAWKFQVPVILLSDKHLSESRMTTSIDENEIEIEKGKIAENPGEDYDRYSITEDGISPMAFPGDPEAIVKNSSYEHDEFGYTTEKPDEIVAMQEKRLDKLEPIKNEIQSKNPVKTYGEEDADTAIVAWGSTKGAVLDAMKLIEKPIKFVQPIYLKPFPEEEILEELGNVSKVICAETNATGQLAKLIRGETGLNIDEVILRYDARPFNPPDLAEEIKEAI
ncbi:MAG: 2-oxoacid:acceptor oxidoreductase subunit alpha [Hadesarchaea archaeon]|nr:2-oxoacid:acceptor oxidoreductase subunit alpha [Hadesarchaea archaeon]